MRKILILGGSKLQLDLIFEAKKLLFEVHLMDGDGLCPGQAFSDYFYPQSFGDKAATLALAQKIQPDLILTCASEVGNLTGCYVSEQLGLNTNTYEVARKTTDKYLMKQVCAAHQIACADYLFLSGEASERLESNKSEDFISRWQQFPCIVKPADSSAGRGVRYVTDAQQFPEAFRAARQFSREDRLLVEAYLPGKQFSIETLSTQGEHQILAITEEFITPLPKIIETQQLMPARISEELEQTLQRFALQVLQAFGVSYGACHLEVRLNEEGLFLVEIASRMGGWRSELLRLSRGIEYCQLLILSHLNLYRPVKSDFSRYAAVKVVLSEQDYQQYQKIQVQMPQCVFSDLQLKTLKTAQHLADANGYYFLAFENLAQVERWMGEHKTSKELME